MHASVREQRDGQDGWMAIEACQQVYTCSLCACTGSMRQVGCFLSSVYLENRRVLPSVDSKSR